MTSLDFFPVNACCPNPHDMRKSPSPPLDESRLFFGTLQLCVFSAYPLIFFFSKRRDFSHKFQCFGPLLGITLCSFYLRSPLLAGLFCWPDRTSLFFTSSNPFFSFHGSQCSPVWGPQVRLSCAFFLPVDFACHALTFSCISLIIPSPCPPVGHLSLCQCFYFLSHLHPIVPRFFSFWPLLLFCPTDPLLLPQM